MKHLSLFFCTCLMACLAVSCTLLRPSAPAVHPDEVRSPLPDSVRRRFDYFFLEAVSAKSAGRYTDAFTLLQHCLDIDPESPAAHYELAQYYFFLKADSFGLRSLEKAVHYAPDNYWYSRMLAGYYRQKDSLNQAVELTRRMTERFPDRRDSYFSLVDLYMQLEQYDQVLQTLERIEQLIGKNEEITMRKFRIYLYLDRREEAFREVSSLADEYPQEYRYQVLLGQVYLEYGREQEAYEIFNRVLAADPGNVLASYSLADYYKLTGQTELYNRQINQVLLGREVPVETKLNVMRQLIADSEQTGSDSISVGPVFERIIRENPDDDQMPMLYSQYLWARNRSDESVPVLQHVLQIDPQNQAARLMLLQLFIRRNDPEAIAGLCRVGVEVSPDVVQFPFYLAIACLQLGQNDEAGQACQMAIDRLDGTEDPGMVSDLYSILGDVCHVQGKLDACFDAYEQAIRHNPLNYGALNNYAYFLSVEKRDLDKAEEMSYKTVKAEPENATYLDTYAWILFEKGRYTEARIYIENALKTEEGASSAVLVEHCGDILYMCGETDAAVTHWERALQMGSDSKTLPQKIRQKKYIAE